MNTLIVHEKANYFEQIFLFKNKIWKVHVLFLFCVTIDKEKILKHITHFTLKRNSLIKYTHVSITILSHFPSHKIEPPLFLRLIMLINIPMVYLEKINHADVNILKRFSK